MVDHPSIGKLDLLNITEDIVDTKRVITHTGPVKVASSVKRIEVKAMYISHGFLNFDGLGDLEVRIKKIVVTDPRGPDGKADDGFHLGGITGVIEQIIGSGLQLDMGKIGGGTHDLEIDSSIGHAVAMGWVQAGHGTPGDAHQDGWQVMHAARVTFHELNYFGGPNSNHAALYCQPNKAKEDIDENDPTLVVDCVANGGIINTKAQGIVLGACTGCGARNMHITASRPFLSDKQLSINPINENNDIHKI